MIFVKKKFYLDNTKMDIIKRNKNVNIRIRKEQDDIMYNIQ
jgi:hypothetical protein